MSNKTLIIAEAGVNHNGDINIAKQLIDVAAEAGVDIVKFQTFKAENLVGKNAPKARYQVQTTGSEESQFDMLRKLELSYDDHIELMNHCRKKNIEFLSTPFDLESIDLLKKMGISIFKIPSGEITNLPYLEKAGKSGKKIILSTGMADMKEIEEAVNVLIKSGTEKDNITVLHCTTEYPAPYQEVNLKAMLSIRDFFDVKIGYSDHTPGIEIPVAAVALGASVIEKHFTLDKNMEGPDHKASLEPAELKAMVSAIRNVEKAMGDGIKQPTPSEIKNIPVARKSIHTARVVKAGHVLTMDDLTMKRPGDGISPMKLNDILEKKTKSSLPEGHKLLWSDIE